MISILSCILMSVVAKVGQSYEALIVGRFFNGISRGFTFTILPLYVSELVSRKTLAVYQTFTGMYIQLGSALGNALGHPAVLGQVSTWPYLMIVSGSISLLFSLFMAPWLPNTPVYLLTKSPNDDSNEDHPALTLLYKLRCVDASTVKQEYKELHAEMISHHSVHTATFREILTKKKYRRQFFASLIILLSIQFCGLQAVLQYTNNIFKTSGVEADMATVYTVGNENYCYRYCIWIMHVPFSGVNLKKCEKVSNQSFL